MLITSSSDLRARIPVLRARGFSIPDICAFLGVKKTLVYDVLTLYRKHGIVYNPYARPTGRRRILQGPQLNAYKTLRQDYPTAFLDEYQYMLLHQYNIAVSISTLCRTNKQLRVTRKKVVIRAREANPFLQAVYLNQIGEWVPDPSWLIFLNESSKDKRTVVRRHGYRPEGL
jgi:transposase